MGKVRRGILRVILGAAVVAAAIVSTGCGKDAKAEKLYIYNWTYYIPDEVIQAFEDRYGVKVVYDVYASNEEMFAKLKAGGTGYDVAFPSGDFVSIMATEGMLQPIDKSRLPNFKNLDPAVLGMIAFDPDNRFSVPYMMGASGVAVNTAFVKDYEHSWNIFDREDLKGRMTMLDDLREAFGPALIYHGFSPNSTDPAEIEIAKEQLKAWSKNLLRFDAESFGKAFANGEVWVVHGYQENVFLEMEESDWDKVDFFIPREGTMAYMDNMVLLKDAKNVDLAYEFIDYILEPAVMAQIADWLALPSINVPARGLMQTEPRYQISDLQGSEFKRDIGAAIDLYNDAWQEIRVGG